METLPIKILFIDAENQNFVLIGDILGNIKENNFEIQRLTSLEETKELVDKSLDCDVVLMNCTLCSDIDQGFFETEEVKTKFNVPVLLLANEIGRSEEQKLLSQGASDILLFNELSPNLLDRSIRYAILHHQTIQTLRQKEEELNLLNKELEKRVAIRTIELAEAHKGLKIALENERKLGELKSRFISMASHEFRTPLTTIISSAMLIGRYASAEQQSKRLLHIDRIKSSAQNLTNILNDLLSLEKLELGKMLHAPKPVNLKEKVEEVLEDMTPVLKKNQLINYIHIGEFCAIVDAHFLRNILINLLSNAIKYSPNEENIRLLVQMRDQELMISVTDKGIGIPEKDKEFMFTRFFRASNTAHIQGTGLGLTIVCRYVELMNGHITFESMENKGTTFEVRVPAGQCDFN